MQVQQTGEDAGGGGDEMDTAPQCQGKPQDLRCSTYSGPRTA